MTPDIALQLTLDPAARPPQVQLSLGFRCQVSVMRLTFCVVISALILQSSVLAGELEYTCTVLAASVLSDEARLTQDAKHGAVGQSFFVKRETGKILGGPFAERFSTLTLLDHKVRNEHTYVVVSAVRSGAAADTLAIYESDEGEAKRFLAVVGESIFTGVCK